mgnify:FL=1
MFGGKDMAKMMKQMGVDMDELDADKVEVHMGDKKMVFNDPDVKKMDAQGNEMFHMMGNYTQEKKETGPEEEDIELVMEKADVSRDEAEEALKNAEDVAEAVIEVS